MLQTATPCTLFYAGLVFPHCPQCATPVIVPVILSLN
jgi:hypothetical protein